MIGSTVSLFILIGLGALAAHTRRMERNGSWSPHTSFRGEQTMRRWTGSDWEYRQPTSAEIIDIDGMSI
jgi:hypothetical protein